ncbi:MAG: PIG-L family deacetylase [Chitinophagaceae bacterium]|nr:PIG-L family deacetylase [Chitinophagaceae bacterium]
MRSLHPYFTIGFYSIWKSKIFFNSIFLISFLLCESEILNAQSANHPIRIIMIGAHPDDCDQDGGGTAALFASMGYAVKFVSVTNGDAGHQSQGGGALAKRRMAEATEAGRRFGVVYDVLDHHDGELLPTLEARLDIIRKIREWNADIVIAPRPNDYHPDHRYTGILVQDAAYMVAVPNVAPDEAPLKKNPVFLYFQDFFQRPNPFRPDIAIDITKVFDQKVHAMDAHESQMYEWLPWIGGYLDKVPAGKEERKKWLGQNRSVRITQEVKTALEKWYGKEKATLVRHAEAFEICEYGMQPSDVDIRRLFPMMNAK